MLQYFLNSSFRQAFHLGSHLWWILWSSAACLVSYKRWNFSISCWSDADVLTCDCDGWGYKVSYSARLSPVLCMTWWCERASAASLQAPFNHWAVLNPGRVVQFSTPLTAFGSDIFYAHFTCVRVQAGLFDKIDVGKGGWGWGVSVVNALIPFWKAFLCTSVHAKSLRVLNRGLRIFDIWLMPTGLSVQRTTWDPDHLGRIWRAS